MALLVGTLILVLFASYAVAVIQLFFRCRRSLVIYIVLGTTAGVIGALFAVFDLPYVLDGSFPSRMVFLIGVVGCGWIGAILGLLIAERVQASFSYFARMWIHHGSTVQKSSKV